MTLPDKLREHSRHTLMDGSRDLLRQAADRIDALEREIAGITIQLETLVRAVEELRAYFEAASKDG